MRGSASPGASFTASFSGFTGERRWNSRKGAVRYTETDKPGKGAGRRSKKQRDRGRFSALSMAIVRIPYSMDIHSSRPNVCDVVLPLSEFDGEDKYTFSFGVSYRVAAEKQADFEEALQNYTERNPEMAYVSRESLQREFDGMTRIIATIGIALAAVVALIGMLNFTNAMITEVVARKREFAMLQSIGMTGGQLLKILILEGISYIAISGVISVVLGSLLSFVILKAMNNVILFFEYRFQVLPFVIIIPVLLLSALLVPLLACRSIRRKSIVERLRESE